jgi:hypothetical protein
MNITTQEYRNLVERRAIGFEQDATTWKDWESRGLVRPEHAHPHIKLAKDRAAGSRFLLAVIDGKHLHWN